MESRKNLSVLALLSIMAVVITSGCTIPGMGTSGVGGGPGVVIEVFEPSLTNVRSNEQITLHLEVRNRGDFNEAPATAQIMGIDPVEWGLYGDSYRYLGLLLAPDAESNTPGGRGVADWTVVSPSLRRGENLRYEPRARVYYNYETKATKPVTFVTTEELRDVQNTGGALSSAATTQTGGPMTVKVTTGNFVRAPEMGQGEYKFNLEIRIDNTGGGTVYGIENPVAVLVEYPQFVVPIGDCPRFEQTGWVPYTSVPTGLAQPIFGKFVKLWNGKYTDLTCEFSIVQPPASRTTANFRVNLAYIYYTDKTTTINVEGTDQF